MSFQNSRKEKFLESIPTACIENKKDRLASKCKFNFSYFCKDQKAGQNFSDWTNKQLIKLLEKLVIYTCEPLNHWAKMPVGKKSGHVLEVYGAFPKKSDFTFPKNVPHQAKWARFRLESSVRLVGFIIPEDFNRVEQNGSGYYFCSNTFYVVFLDKNHVFYK